MHYCFNIKGTYARIYDSNKWKLKSKMMVIDEIYDKNREFVEENMNNFVKNLDKTHADVQQRWLDIEETSDKIKKIKDDLQLLLNNEKEMIIKTNQD